jgi:2-polyprenyl-6-methoxyphenol hydroxylase-like FAD-dependent oxidoreductase
MENSADFIVVGAGPVGLLTALGLARAKASILVLEDGSALNDSPRAMTYTDPTMQLMNRLGILDDAEAVGIQNRQINFVWPSDDLVITIDTVKAEPSRVYPHNLQFGQEALGALTMNAFLNYPGTGVRFNHKVKGISQGADHATVTVETPDGDRDYQAKYVIGCDGASSVVRKLLGLEFEGFTWPERFVATNVYYDFSARGWQNVHMICSGPEWGLVAKINNDKGGLWRVTFPEDPDLSPVEIEARIHNHHYKRILPDDGPYELQGWAPYRVHERTAPTYNMGRIVLAGDAAHICNPCGGRGLTGGIMDVDRLLNAFEAILNGASARNELDAYTHDRRTEFLEVSSPFASMMKGMWERSDPDMQKKDQAEIMKLSVGSSNISLAGIKRRESDV